MADRPAMTYKKNPVGSGVSYESEQPMRGSEKPARMQFDVVNGNPRLRVYDNRELKDGEKATPILQANFGQTPFFNVMGALKKVLNNTIDEKVEIEVKHNPRDAEGNPMGVKVQSIVFVGRDKGGVIFIAMTSEEVGDIVKFPLRPSYWAMIPNKTLTPAQISDIHVEGLLLQLPPLIAATAVSTYPGNDAGPGVGGGGGGEGRNYQKKQWNNNEGGYQKKQYDGGGYQKKQWNNNGGGNNGGYQKKQWNNNNGGNNYQNNNGGGGNNYQNREQRYSPNEELPI